MRRPTAHLWPCLLVVSAGVLFGLSCRTTTPNADEQPLRFLRFAVGEGRSQRLVVFLPGRWDSPRDVQRRGLLQELELAGWSAEVWAVDLSVRHFRDGRVAERLQRSVVAAIPAERLPCTLVLGISMGGLAAILADQATRAPWTLVLLSPYIGELPQAPHSAERGTPPRWEEQVFREVERWSGDRLLEGRVWLGFGTADRLAVQQRWLAARLPEAQVAELAGGHDWPTWRRLFAVLLQRIPQERCGASGVSGP